VRRPLIALCPQTAQAADTSPTFPKSRVDPCDNITLTMPVESGATSANSGAQYMGAQAHEACAHTWPPGPQACRHFSAAADGYKIAAALAMKPSERIAQLGYWMDARRAYGWAMAYCKDAGDKDRAGDGFAEAMSKTYAPSGSP
jgi:hypothetical protein